MLIGPPSRNLASEIAIAALIFVGALAAAMLAALCLSAIPMMLIPGNDEGPLFLEPGISNSIGLLVNPVIFTSIAANHCRRVTPYFVPLTTVVWLLQFVFLRRQHLSFEGEPVAATAFAGAGVGLAYWLLRRKHGRLSSSKNSLATSH